MQLNSEHTDQPIGSSPNGSKPYVVGSTVILGDCVEVMKGFEENQFDLAIVDPPYGIGMSKVKSWSNSKLCLAKSNIYKTGDWDNNIPDEEYFEQLFRVSKNQIIWGGNYFTDFLPASPSWIIWDKENDGTKTADCEMAWTSFEGAARIFRWMWRGFLQAGEAEKKIHMCQKPVKLYEWLLINYAGSAKKILDTHLGSGSNRIACDNMGFDFTGIEMDEGHYNDQEKRFKQYKSQLRIEGW